MSEPSSGGPRAQPEPLRAFSRTGVRHLRNPGSGRITMDAATCAAARTEIAAWPGYTPTPLVALPGLAAAIGIGSLHYKDEAPRFGLGSFKALGGAYAVLHVIAAEVLAQTNEHTDFARIRAGEHDDVAAGVTVVTATDGNHGRSVAWGAQRFGCRAKIYLHAGVSQGRADAVRAFGADVVWVDGTYDDSVRQAAQDGARNGWFLVADTVADTVPGAAPDAVPDAAPDAADPSDAELPRQVMAGYTMIVAEALEQVAQAELPTHVFVPGGVGGLAAASLSHLSLALGEGAPRFVVVEPDRAPCLFESARNGTRTPVPIEEETVMAGLSCGEPSALAWPIVASGADDFVTIPDELVAPAMTLLGKAPFGDPRIVAGESAVAGLCALLAASTDSAMRAGLGLAAHSRVLLLGTEGATDPEIYRELTGLTP